MLRPNRQGGATIQYDVSKQTVRRLSSADVIQAVDLFAGAGGLTLGFKRAGIATVCAVEIDAYCVQTYAAHTPDADVLHADIRRLDLNAYRGKIDLVYGGPPCQPFSSGGLRAASLDERDMIPEFVSAVERISPAAFFMENVPGLASGDRRRYLTAVLGELASLGFHVAWKVMNAADFGVPQKRRRLFVIGMKSRTFNFPRETHGPDRGHARVSVRDILPAAHSGEPNRSKVFYAKNPDLRPSPYDGHLFNGGGRPINLDEPCHTILASAGGNKTHFFDDLCLVPEYHAHLLRGGEPRAGAMPGGRRLTIAESAIIQTIPADLRIHGPQSPQYEQIGNAVPPMLAAVMGKALVTQMTSPDGIDEESFHPAQFTLSL